jgi:protein phosphatase
MSDASPPHLRLHLSWGGYTHKGRVRDVNQDALHAEAGLFAVADGMGGHQGGEVAAQLAMQVMATSPRSSAEELVQAIRAANRAVFDQAGERSELAGMGTTVVSMAVIDTDEATLAVLASVGDSRVYRWRSGDLEQLTTDHNYVAELVRRGELSPNAAATHPYRNMLTRAVGVEPDVAVDMRIETLDPGDRYVLCSDGLTNELSDHAIATVLRRQADPTDAARELIRLANEAGGRDNITALIVDVSVDPLDEEAVAAAAATTAPLPVTGDAAVGEDRDSEGPRVAQAVLVGVAAVGILVAAVSLLTWYARGGYFVGFDGDEVTINQGRPGGVLWFSPTIEERTAVFRDELAPTAVETVEGEPTSSSYRGAHDTVRDLQLVDGAPSTAAPGATEPTATTAPATTATAPASTPPSTASTPEP